MNLVLLNIETSRVLKVDLNSVSNRWDCWLLLWIALACAPARAEERTDDRKELLRLHAMAVENLQDVTGQHSAISEEVQERLEHVTGVALRGSGREISWIDVLKLTEFGLKRQNVKVMLTVKSSPLKCAVHYTPVIGGDGLDAGWTTAMVAVDPKYYQITCKCGQDLPTLRVDVTSDHQVEFLCEDKRVPDPKK